MFVHSLGTINNLNSYLPISHTGKGRRIRRCLAIIRQEMSIPEIELTGLVQARVTVRSNTRYVYRVVMWHYATCKL